MHVGVISDTHDNLDVVSSAVDLFAAEADTVIHCGDFVAPFSVTPFDDDFEFYAVRGNNDGEWMLHETIQSFGTDLGEMGELTLDDNSFAVYHGTSQPIVDALVACGSYEYVLHGHTHQRVHEEVDGTVRINPGGIAITPDSGGDPPAGVIIDTESGEVTFHDLK